MQTYELMVIVKTDFPVDDEHKRTALLEKLVKNATFEEVTVLGKRELAYPINKVNEGIYLLMTVKADKLDVSNIEREMKLGTDVIRYLITKKE